jgi:hypothetical protein
MMAIFHLAVKIAATGYLLYKLWIIVFRYKLFGLWERIPLRQPKQKEPTQKIPREPKTAKVVGKTKTEYIDNPVIEAIPLVPVEPETDNVADEEFEVGPNPERPSDEELYGADNVYPPVTDYSTGLTFEQLAEAIEYVSDPVEEENEKMMRAAETLSKLRGSDLFELIEREVSNTEAIGRLMDDCLDSNGERLPIRKSKGSAARLSEFSIETYV